MKGRTLSVLAALVAVVTLAAACGSGPAPTSGAKAGDTSTSHTPTSVTIGSEVAPPTLDLTANPAAAIDEVMDDNVYQHLVQLDPAGDLVPVLATRYRLSANRRTYTFTIRRHVTFSNGDPLTPADVVFSMRRVIAPHSTYPYASLWSMVQSVRAAGPDAVAVTLSHPDWEWLFTLAAYSNGAILDPRTVATLATKPVGTGPFVETSFVPNYSVTLARNPHYWGTRPRIGTVTWRYFSSPNGENAALEAGQINIIDNEPTPQDVARFKENPEFQVVNGPTNGKVQLTLNNSYGPLRSPLVRQAISDATDKQAIDEAAAGGYAVTLGSDSVPGDPYYVDLAGTYRYDPGKARQLLARAGYPHGFSLTLTLPPYSYAQTAGPLIAAELGAVGIHTTIKNIQWPLWLSQVFAHSDFQATIIDHAEARDIANYADPTYYWRYAHTREVAALLQRGDQAATRGEWIASYRQVLHLITAQAVNDWLYVLPQLTIADRSIVGLPRTGLTESFPVQYLRYGGRLPAGVAGQGYTS